MKKLVLSALLLASSTAFAQSSPVPAATTSPTEAVKVAGRNMGMLPAIQEICGGYTAKQKAEFKDGLSVKMAKKMSAEQGADMGKAYLKGFEEGAGLAKLQMGGIPPALLADSCKQFKAKYPEILESLKNLEPKK